MPESRIGRQPNSVKHATLLALQHIKSAKGLPITSFHQRDNIVKKRKDVVAGVGKPMKGHRGKSMKSLAEAGVAQMSADTHRYMTEQQMIDELEYCDGAIVCRSPSQIKQEFCPVDSPSPSKYDAGGDPDLQRLYGTGKEVYEIDASSLDIQRDLYSNGEAASTWSAGHAAATNLLSAQRRASEYDRQSSTSHWQRPSDGHPHHQRLSVLWQTSSTSGGNCDEEVTASQHDLSLATSEIAQLHDPSITSLHPSESVSRPSSPLPSFETVISVMRKGFKDLTPILSRVRFHKFLSHILVYIFIFKFC